MTTEQIINTLREYNAWRRDGESEMLDPKLIGKTIDAACDALEESSHWKAEYEIVSARLRGQTHPNDNGIVSDDEIIPKLKRERDEAREAFVVAADQMVQAQCKTREALRERDEARNSLSACMYAMPFGNIQTHTLENLPARIGDLASALAEETDGSERLERERDEAREALDRASLYILNHTGSCPYELLDIEPHDSPCSEVCDKYTNDMNLCWKKHFTSKEARND